MATQSFMTEFKFTAKSGRKIANAIENSHYEKHEIKQKVNIIRNPETVSRFMDDLLKQKS